MKGLFILLLFISWFTSINAQVILVPRWDVRTCVPTGITKPETKIGQSADIQPDIALYGWKKISPKQIRTDIKFTIKKLKKKHFDINWEGREKEIISGLNNIAEIQESISLDSFLTRLKAVISTIDDGHTRIVSAKLKRNKSGFKCVMVDEETILLRLPNFTSRWKLKRTLRKFKILKKNPKINRIIIDIRGNLVGYSNLVQDFLENTMTKDFQLFEWTKIKRKNSALEIPVNLVRRIQKYKREGDYFVKRGKLVKVKNQNHIEHKYLLVDSTIISGAMLATYHLKKDGYLVLGSDPSSLFNTFGNNTAVVLPRSGFYLYIATSRLIVDKNSKHRNDDMLHCDYPLINGQIPVGLIENPANK